jgi:hypothetical protein
LQYVAGVGSPSSAANGLREVHLGSAGLENRVSPGGTGLYSPAGRYPLYETHGQQYDEHCHRLP